MSDTTNPLAAAAAEVAATTPKPRGRPPGPKPRAQTQSAPEPVINAQGNLVNSTETRLKSEVTPDFGTPEYATYIARIRDTRKPFGDFKQKLARQARPGYYRVWINDEPGRIQQASHAGYNHVKDADGKIEVFTVNPRSKDAASQLAYLMEIPLEIWELDQIAKHKRADDIEAAIRKSKVIASSASDVNEDAGGFYVPGGGSKVENIGKGRV